jgi:hypothetical protein
MPANFEANVGRSSIHKFNLCPVGVQKYSIAELLAMRHFVNDGEEEEEEEEEEEDIVPPKCRNCWWCRKGLRGIDVSPISADDAICASEAAWRSNFLRIGGRLR